MKKIISILAIIAVLTILIFTGNTYAAAISSFEVQPDKTTIRPGEEVKVTATFGEALASYTINVAYDKNIFEYVSVDGGQANDTTDKVIVTFHDATGGTNPRQNMSVTFRAKGDITTSNPTEFTVTATGMAKIDGGTTTTFDDITTPIIKNVTVEPQYIDYTLKLETTGEIVKGQEKAMTLSYSSPMGHYYEHARLIAEATTPTGATVKLLANDITSVEHDIIQSGWGDAQGFKIGGKDVSQTLQVRGTFSEVGDYGITLKLIDRDNSDAVITQQTFKFNAVETATIQPTPNPDTTPDKVEEISKQETPTELPKTGANIYIPVLTILVVLIGSCIFLNRKK